ncbi:MAG TPA: fumarate hydratase [Bacteroidales bacterium]|jgi:hypothetical protein|nr:fumarate hydratase [Bacteroidales bacterium]
MNLAISADIIAFTTLPDEDRRRLEKGIKGLLYDLENKFKSRNFFGRMVQGDRIECAMTEANFGLRVMLLLKTYVKSISISHSGSLDKRFKYFTLHGLRAAMAVAPLATIDPDNGIIDGEAIYLSGRTLASLTTYNKKKIIIKQTLFFLSSDSELQNRIEPLIILIDTLLAKASAKQSEVLFYKLSGLTEKEIGNKLAKNQSTISQHSNAAGWYAIDKALNYFEKNIY